MDVHGFQRRTEKHVVELEKTTRQTKEESTKMKKSSLDLSNAWLGDRKGAVPMKKEKEK